MIGVTLRRPRVLLLHNFLTPYRVPLFTELARRFDLDVWILGDVRKIRQWPKDAPRDVFRCRMLPHIGLPTGSRDWRILINPTLPVALSRHAHDVILCTGWDTPAAFWAGWWAKRRGTPFVLWSGSTAREPNWRRTITRPLVAALVRAAGAWIAYGTRAQEYLVSLGADEGRIFCAYNTVDVAQFAGAGRMNPAERESFKRVLGITTPYTVLYCGQLIERKGLGDLIPAFARLAHQRCDVTLLVVGSGRCEMRFRTLAQREGIGDRVRFIGFVARDDLPPYYAMADLFALPSREEVWGLVINEAFACGTPVLTTDAAGASADLMQHGVNGYVTLSRDPDAIYGALAAHFAPSTNRDVMREAARASVAPFTIARMADSFESAVACVLNRRAGA